MVTEGSDLQAWLLTLASSLACIFGALFICADLVVRQLPGYHDFDLRNDKRFLVGGLSLGAGVLLFTALNRILPEGLEYLQKEDSRGRKVFEKKAYAEVTLMASFLAGVILCIALNSVLHRLTPKSIIHCGDEENARDEGQEDGVDDARSHASPSPQEHSPSRHGHGHRAHDQETPHASTPLLPKSHSVSSRPHFRSAKSRSDTCGQSQRSICAGYTDPCKHKHCCSSQAKDGAASQHEHTDDDHTTDHHHHVTEERHDLMRIGLQTAIAISLHKLPEGFITFMSSHRDATLGFSIFLALGIHNIVEGFTIAFPLFLAFHSRTKAILAACALGGLSQPLGAFLAWLITRTSVGRTEDSLILDLGYGILFGTTAGFMSVISVAQLLPSAIRNDAHDGLLFTSFFFLGTAIIGLSGALTG